MDWAQFDIARVHHYWSEKIKDRYVDRVKPLFAFEKPVLNTEFGFSTTSAPVIGGALSFGNVNNVSRFLHQLPIVGRFIRPRLSVIHNRDQALQAKRLAENLALMDKAGFDGAFVSTVIFPLSPYSDTPKYDLDRESASLVKYYSDRRHGTTYPDMPWEPKASFKAAAEYYATHV